VDDLRSPERPGPVPDAGRVGLLLGLVGLVAFGGPAAHVALMRRLVVEREGWLDSAEFNRMFAACNLIPGPSSTELAMFIGYRLAGRRGLLVAAVTFIAPAFFAMLALAALYERYAGSRGMGLVLHGVRPVVVAILAWAAIDLARKGLGDRRLLLLAPPALGLYLLGVNPVFALAACGLAGLGIAAVWSGRINLAVTAFLAGPHPERLLPLFATFLKIGAISYGSGYVLFAYLDSDFVKGLGWLRPEQLVDAVAAGQVTPGPVFTTATFLGYLFAGLPGAVLATVGIFLPGLLMVPLLARFLRLVERRPALRASLDAVNAAVIGLVAAVLLEVGRAALVDPLTVLIAGVALPVIWWRPLAAPALVAAAALAGLASGATGLNLA